MKIVLEDTNSGYNLSNINQNFATVEQVVNDQLLSRVNPTNSTNEMHCLLDMNGYPIINLPAPISRNSPARLQDVQSATSGLPNASLVPFTPYTTVDSINVQGALQEIIDVLNSISVVADKVNTLAALRLVDHTKVTSIHTSGYSAVNDQGHGDWNYISTDTTSADNGGTIVVDSTGGRWYREDVGFITPQMFGATSAGSANDDVAFNAAWAYALANRKMFVLKGAYLINSWDVVGAHVLRIFALSAEIRGGANTAKKALVRFFECSDIKVYGELQVECQYNTNYAAGIQIYGTTSAQYFELTNVSVTGAYPAWRWGDAAYPDALVSENTITGGHTFGCPWVCHVIGVEAFLTVVSPTWICDVGSGNSAWIAQQKYGIVADGAGVKVIGGELLNVSDTAGVLCQTSPIASTLYQNRYGSIKCYNVEIENAGKLAQAINRFSVTPYAGQGELTFDGCDGFVGSDTDVLIFTDSVYTGDIVVRNSKFYYLAGTRTKNNIQCDGTGTHVYIDRKSFSTGFKDYIAGISGGIVHFDNETVLEVLGLNSLSFANATQTLMPFISASTAGPLTRWLSSYNGTTGIFTIPAGGLNNIDVSCSVMVSGVTAGEMRIYVNGALTGAAPFVIGVGNFNMKFSSLAAGTTIQMAVFAQTGTGTANPTSAVNRFSIMASK